MKGEFPLPGLVSRGYFRSKGLGGKKKGTKGVVYVLPRDDVPGKKGDRA